MNVPPPSLWDNLDLERGLDHLAKLQMEEALVQLNRALNSSINREDTQKTIDATQYWQPKIAGALASKYSPDIAGLLSDFGKFLFIPRLSGFRKSLIGFIADCEMEKRETDFSEVQTIFDLLLQSKNFKKAEHLMLFLIKRHPQKGDLLYFLAQAQWLKGEKGKAKKSYLMALLKAPGSALADRIEYKELRKIVEQSGFALAPAHGWIQGILPLYSSPDEISAQDESHQMALNGYYHLLQAHRSLEKNDTKSSVYHRKKLKEETPELYKAYFEMLEKRGK